jgi:hypothetical protein
MTARPAGIAAIAAAFAVEMSMTLEARSRPRNVST